MRGALHGPGVRPENHQQGQMQRQGKDPGEKAARLSHLKTTSRTRDLLPVLHCTLDALEHQHFSSVFQEHMIQNEVAILRRVKHPNIVLLIEEVDTYNELYLVMELVKARLRICSLFQRGRLRKKIRDQRLLRAAAFFISAL